MGRCEYSFRVPRCLLFTRSHGAPMHVDIAIRKVHFNSENQHKVKKKFSASLHAVPLVTQGLCSERLLRGRLFQCK